MKTSLEDLVDSYRREQWARLRTGHRVALAKEVIGFAAAWSRSDFAEAAGRFSIIAGLRAAVEACDAQDFDAHRAACRRVISLRERTGLDAPRLPDTDPDLEEIP